MRREELEHVLRAASAVAGEPEFLVVGSAAILGTYDEDELPMEATRSDEADLAPYNDPDGQKSLRIEGSLGQGSRFHQTFGYYADGVDFRTAIAPKGWESRLVPFERPGSIGARGMCLDPHDLGAAKLAAGREKDYAFVRALLDERLLDIHVLTERVELLPSERVIPGFLARARRWVRDYAEPT